MAFSIATLPALILCELLPRKWCPFFRLSNPDVAKRPIYILLLKAAILRPEVNMLEMGFWSKSAVERELRTMHSCKSTDDHSAVKSGKCITHKT
jgi:hypothetical protein